VVGADPIVFVRSAVPADIEVLAALERIARDVMREQRGGRRRLEECPAVGDRWGSWIAETDRAVVVAGLDEAVFAWLSIRAPDIDGVAVIDSVYVEEGARELGLGDDLVSWALAWARDRQATSVESWALPGDRETKNLFERNGLTARLITVSRSLSGPATEVDASR